MNYNKCFIWDFVKNDSDNFIVDVCCLPVSVLPRACADVPVLLPLCLERKEIKVIF